MHPDHEDNSPHHNCSLNFKRLLCNSCNTKKGIEYHNLVKAHTEFNTSWLHSDYSLWGFDSELRARQNDCVCVPVYVSASASVNKATSMSVAAHGGNGNGKGKHEDVPALKPEIPFKEEFEIVTHVRPMSEMVEVRKKEKPKEVGLELHIERAETMNHIIPRDTQVQEDYEDSYSGSQIKNKEQEPKYFLYFILMMRLGYRFKARDAKEKFALNLNIPRGTIKNHYLPTMSCYFTRDEQGFFTETREPDTKTFLEDVEIIHLIKAWKENNGRLEGTRFWKLVELYADVLDMTTIELVNMIAESPKMRP